MLGNQNNGTNQSENPFVGFQTAYLSLFTNVLAPNEENYQKGVNDTAHFRVTLRLDDNQKRHSDGKEYWTLPSETKVSGFLKSASVIEETIKGKVTKKIQITLFDPNQTYINPFEAVDQNNPKNNKTIGAVYIIKTAFTLKGKEMLQKLANVDPNVLEPITISVGKAYCPPDYKELLVINGKQVFNIYVRQGEESIGSRFGDPSKSSKVVNDNWNETYLKLLEDNADDKELLRASMDSFYIKFIKNHMVNFSKNMFLKVLNQMGYDLVENGVDKDGVVKFKYVSIGQDVDIANVTNYAPATAPASVPASKGATSSPDDDEFVVSDDEDLPF
jgi:hypothetical protein